MLRRVMEMEVQGHERMRKGVIEKNNNQKMCMTKKDGRERSKALTSHMNGKDCSKNKINI